MNKLEATQEAAKTVAALGPEWKPKVWNNLGWHWAVQSKTMYLWKSQHSESTWHVLANTEDRLPGGRYEWSVSEASPEEAIASCLDKMQKDIMERTEVWSQTNKTAKLTQLHMKGLES